MLSGNDMLGAILKIWLAIHLGRAAYRHGYGTPTMPLWKWCGWLAFGITAEWMLLKLKVSMVTTYGADYRYQVDPFVLACFLIGGWVLLPSPFCWLCGRLKRPSRVLPDDQYYFAQDGQTHGPLPLQSIVEMQRSGQLGDDTQLCHEGSETWQQWHEVLARPPKPPWRFGLWMNTALANAKENLKPSSKMNYRIIIPAFVLAMLVGALLHNWLGERYRFQAVGNGVMMKTDRWTGEAWIMRSTLGRWETVK